MTDAQHPPASSGPKPSSSVKLVLLGEAAVGKVKDLFDISIPISMIHISNPVSRLFKKQIGESTISQVLKN